MIPKVAGVIWFRNRDDYLKCLSIFEDAFNYPATYENWFVLAEKRLKEIEHSGWIPVKAVLDPETFPSWCADRFLKIDTEGRVAFANWVASEHLKASGMI